MRDRKGCNQCQMCLNVVKKAKILWFVHKDILHLFPICKSCEIRQRLSVDTEPLFVTVILDYMHNRGMFALDAFELNDLHRTRRFMQHITTIHGLRRTGLFLSRSSPVVVDRTAIRWFPSRFAQEHSFRDSCRFVCVSTSH